MQIYFAAKCKQLDVIKPMQNLHLPKRLAAIEGPKRPT